MLIILHLSFMIVAALFLIIGVAMAIFWRSKNYLVKSPQDFQYDRFYYANLWRVHGHRFRSHRRG